MRFNNLDDICDWQACSKEYIKTTEFYWVLVNRFANYKPVKIALWAWSGWTVELSHDYQDSRSATMLEF